jgi:hypothetical protein
MSSFTKAMRFVGDLDDEFYHDERQRDVWNEASAIGFQLFLWCSLIAGAVLPWVAGVPGSYTALGILLVLLTISWIVTAYTKSRGVDMQTSQKLIRPRLFLYLGLYFSAAIGIVVTLVFSVADGSVRSPTIVGMVFGAILGLVCAAYGIARSKRLAREDEIEAENLERSELLERNGE